MMVFVNDPKNLREAGRNPFTVSRDCKVISHAAEVEFPHFTTLRYVHEPVMVEDLDPTHEWHVNAWMQTDRVSYRVWEGGALSEWRVA